VGSGITNWDYSAVVGIGAVVGVLVGMHFLLQAFLANSYAFAIGRHLPSVFVCSTLPDTPSSHVYVYDLKILLLFP